MTQPPAEPRRRPRPYPEPPPKRSRLPLIAAIAVVVLAALAVGGVILLADDKTTSGQGHAPPTQTSTVFSPSTSISTDVSSDTSSPSATESASTSGSPSATGSVTEPDARGVVVAYLNDVNDRDVAAAGRLICAARHDTWKKNAESSTGDFAYTVTSSTFQSSQRDSTTGGLVLKYSLAFSDGTTNIVTFTVIAESGLKICGIT